MKGGNKNSCLILSMNTESKNAAREMPESRVGCQASTADIDQAVLEPMHLKIFRVALEWCEKHPGWVRICDVADTSILYKTWDELPPRERKGWTDRYHESDEAAWNEFGYTPCKVPVGFVGTDGVFYPRITDIPTNTNGCQVYDLTGWSRTEEAK